MEALWTAEVSACERPLLLHPELLGRIGSILPGRNGHLPRQEGTTRLHGTNLLSAAEDVRAGQLRQLCIAPGFALGVVALILRAAAVAPRADARLLRTRGMHSPKSRVRQITSNPSQNLHPSPLGRCSGLQTSQLLLQTANFASAADWRRHLMKPAWTGLT